MKSRFKRLKWLLLAVIIAVGAVYAAWEIRKPDGPPTVKWKGVLTIWTSDGEDITTLLNACSAAFTDRNKNTHIMVRTMERSTMELYLKGAAPAQTQMPDIVIFSSGMISEPAGILLPITMPEEVLPFAAGITAVDGISYAVPFLVDLPVMIGQDLPKGHDELKELLEADPPKKATYQVFEGNPEALLLAAAGTGGTGIKAKLISANADDGYALSRTIANGTKLFVGSYRQARRALTRGLQAAPLPRAADGKALITRSVCAGIVKQDDPDDDRLAAAAAFAGYLTEERAQLGVIALGYFPTTALMPEHGEGDTAAQSLYDALLPELENSFAPGAFESSERQEKRRQAAASILMGDLSYAPEWEALCR